MFPYFSIFGHTIPAYSLLSLTGVLLALLYYLRARRHSAFPEADGELVIIYGVAGAFFGAKLLFLSTVLPEFFRNFHFLFSETEIFLETYLYSGFVFYGGFYGKADSRHSRKERLRKIDLVEASDAVLRAG